MKEDQIKEAFLKVKQDMFSMYEDITNLRNEIIDLKSMISALHEDMNNQKMYEIHKNNLSTHRQISTTDTVTSTDTSTVPQEVEGLKPPNLGISTGNEGASTDRQTDTSTDRQTDKPANLSEFLNPKTSQTSSDTIESNIHEAKEILDSLDGLKKQIRLKFKRITPQEMTVFSTIYQLEEQDPNNTTYKEISQKLGLSQSSIRDYVQRMINKGIPIKKQKINNKKLVLSISSELKKIATLATIIQLREL